MSSSFIIRYYSKIAKCLTSHTEIVMQGELKKSEILVDFIVSLRRQEILNRQFIYRSFSSTLKKKTLNCKMEFSIKKSLKEISLHGCYKLNFLSCMYKVI